jgi:hypothetical protein
LQGLNSITEVDGMAALPYADSNFLLENCILISYYAASSGNSLLMFQGNLLVLFSRVKNLGLAFLTSDDRTDRLS